MVTINSQIVNLKNVIEVNKKELPSFPHLSSVGHSRGQDEGHHGGDIVGHLLGKRPRDG
jgi:hypothetical protein